ncbi:SprT family protein [Mangrovibacillus cuniculi]|uniref:Protein SprT-like n=1 Tax=Mangrovibacillus cuniculi TaxID=2593652 RepID=A0A7S8HGN8_9BACI|nr:SprT family protein [Mangrovibacillus cuniculi]QPC48199.1 SprT family protein [Mangrovibacillus cuniculi]
MTNEELQQLVEDLSVTYFHKKFVHRAYFNSRLKTTGGRYLLKSHNIDINPGYIPFKEELKGIILHELCHYHLHIEGRGYKHGDEDFKRLLKRVGAPRFCTPLQPRAKQTVKYIYECTTCHMQYPRKRRMDTKKYACGKCRGKLKERLS